MADKGRSLKDTYTMIKKGNACYSALTNSAEIQRCANLPDNATEAQQAECFRYFQKAYQDCSAAGKAWAGSGGKDVPPPPKPPSK
jgi:hypothetical protein